MMYFNCSVLFLLKVYFSLRADNILYCLILLDAVFNSADTFYIWHSRNIAVLTYYMYFSIDS